MFRLFQMIIFDKEWDNQGKELKIPKISTSKYKPPKPVTQKDPPLNRPSKYIYGKLPSNTK